MRFGVKWQITAGWTATYTSPSLKVISVSDIYFEFTTWLMMGDITFIFYADSQLFLQAHDQCQTNHVAPQKDIAYLRLSTT